MKAALARISPDRDTEMEIMFMASSAGRHIGLLTARSS
jgi:hypothetical protein